MKECTHKVLSGRDSTNSNTEFCILRGIFDSKEVDATQDFKFQIEYRCQKSGVSKVETVVRVTLNGLPLLSRSALLAFLDCFESGVRLPGSDPLT